MDDTSAVCAETLNWVAYDACGHKEVCSTCVARSRFISHDCRCSICNSPSRVVFATKDLGEYTKRIRDFSVLPFDAEEGRVGEYWYHEGTQVFDDFDHYKMIKAMCELSCSVCDRMEDWSVERFRIRVKFENIEQLDDHFFHKHRLFMCSLCFEGKKLFVCEQKLYTRPQLRLMELKLTEMALWGILCVCSAAFHFMGKVSFIHMRSEHYTCRMCVRQDAGQYVYYQNYEHLEVGGYSKHFRSYHFLYEEEECREKQFVVFLTEQELKMQENEHIRMRFRDALEHSGDELSLAIQAGPKTANTPVFSPVAAADHEEFSNYDVHFPPLEQLAITESEPSSKHLEVLSQTSFPLLPMAPSGHQQNGQLHVSSQTSFPTLPVAPPQKNSSADVLPKNTMATHLRRHRNNNKLDVISSAPAWTAASHAPAKPAKVPPDAWPPVHSAYRSVSSSGEKMTATENRPVPSSYATAASTLQSSASGSSFPCPLTTSRNWGNQSQNGHSISSHNLSDGRSVDSFNTDFPPVSVSTVQTCKSASTVKKVKKMPDMHITNKSLVGKMQVALGFDEDKYSNFKAISGEYRQGLMDAETYLVYMDQYGLLHLVLELARLLPDATKQKELVETYNANLVATAPRERSGNNGTPFEDNQRSKENIGKTQDSRNNNWRKDIADNIKCTVKEPLANCSLLEADSEPLSKHGVAKGKSTMVVDNSQEELSKLGKSTKTKMKITIQSSGAVCSQSWRNGNGTVTVKQQRKSRSISSKG